ncbi:hypothetical protein F751_1716 [Auxenochlorella protothecoides]|uniref:Uncharacterized protein n=2 Tax=Auxenochlorella protothecoides TaxID=3075 RepID=A0A087SGI3_AUXPR|nr:hypothetical protein F751_1716 [Auxenochlorella protothecoides]KFM24837.1 hypothetical protein F751_1716 [Auxenochlorella protothecoides]RMZ52732.1 hypothetical protein APUTEX25_000851 [Auxenochlorella protothecoides]|eukprot:RMZ52732.1 hypothetical protein APUTEX25_000851 [Auxenochlorella protothecoides]
MAKSLRSKVKRHFRLLRRDVVNAHDNQLSKEEQRQAAMDAAAAAPPVPTRKAPSPSGEEGAEEVAQGMDIDSSNLSTLPEVTPQNSAKILKKLRAQRLAATKGVQASSKKKKATGALVAATRSNKSKSKKRR